ncbi:Flp family type IVb pilin [Methylobacterium sp. C33D]|uniref:Flp family type IVb pilin n=1 Tax=Methylobacterium mesophilicum TaxID=39956 RepID=UPI002F351B66
MRSRGASAPAGRLRAATARFARDVRGSTATEYALLGGLIFLVAVGSIRFYVSRVSAVYGDITAAVTQGP